MPKTIPIMELFGPTIQGEGIMSGTFTTFLRTGGCSLRCSWCDSMDAVLPEKVKELGTRLATHEILRDIAKLPYAPYCTFTGGDPCMHKGLGDIIAALNMENIMVAVETQGELFPDWLITADVVTFSPKGPSSGNIVDIDPLYKWLRGNRNNTNAQRVCIKIVCFNEEDVEYALDVYGRIPVPLYDAFYLTSGTAPFSEHMIPEARILDLIYGYQTLSNHLLKMTRMNNIEFNHKTHVGFQQHVALWPTVDKGV